MQSLVERLRPFTNVNAVPVDNATNAGSCELARRLELARAVAPMLVSNPDALHIALDGQAIA